MCFGKILFLRLNYSQILVKITFTNIYGTVPNVHEPKFKNIIYGRHTTVSLIEN